jgi:hypothetical protein
MSQNNTSPAKVVQDTAHGFLPVHINGTVMLSASETSLGIARFAESKNDLRFFASLRMTTCFLFLRSRRFANL